MEIKLMVVPGRALTVNVPAGATVLDVAKAAEMSVPSVNWVGLAKEREVRVQNRKFSNDTRVDASQGYAGSIVTTPLNDGDVVLILTKIKGNQGPGVLTCFINQKRYALETPDEVQKVLQVLKDETGIDPNRVITIHINGRLAHKSQLVGQGDKIEVQVAVEEEADEEGLEIEIDGVVYFDKLDAIQAILDL